MKVILKNGYGEVFLTSSLETVNSKVTAYDPKGKIKKDFILIQFRPVFE